MQKILFLALIAIGILFQSQLLRGHGGIIDDNRIKVQIEKQKQVNIKLKERNAILEMKIAGLKGSADSLEARSRNELNLVKPGEVLVLLPGSDLNQKKKLIKENLKDKLYMYALEIDGVSKNYGDFQALDQINFVVEEGSFVGLLGVNGAGKTTLISSIAGINKFRGKIKVMGYDVIRDVVKAKRCLGVVPQELAYDPFLTVYQTLKFQSGLYGVKNNQSWLDEVINRLYLRDKVDSTTRNLSGGMKRRLMVAQALVHKPPVIILDEPTAGVDVELRKSLWEFIVELNKDGHTILLTTHYLEEVEKLCNKIIMINKGKIIAQSSKAELINQSGNLPTMVEIETVNGEITDELANWLVLREGNLFTFKLDSSDQLLSILSLLKLANIKIENISIKHPSLEDIFINYVHG